MELLLAKSLNGHDKGRMYVVLGEDGSDVILVDGRKRLLDNPKHKRRSHVQLVRHFPAKVTARMQEVDCWTDERVRIIIGIYLKEESEIV
ncbi:MAG: hypothetical protein IJV04_01875 [Lachnospiraceae bacterium]|nr:hypothetical protein [Lachnospiraceae bacterium]